MKQHLDMNCCRGQQVIPKVHRYTNFLTEATWTNHCMFSLYLWDNQVSMSDAEHNGKGYRQQRCGHTCLHTRTHAHRHTYTQRETLSHTDYGVTGSILGRLWQSHDAGHSLAAMKLMWGLVRGNSGRLLLNSVISWTNDGWGSDGAGARLTSFWAGNSPTSGQESISLDSTCTDTLCLLGASMANKSL